MLVGILLLQYTTTCKCHNEVGNFSNYCQQVRKAIEDSRKDFLLNPSAHRVHRLPMLHRENIPICPIVFSVSSPINFLCRHLPYWLKHITNFSPTHSIKSTHSLIERLNKCKIPPNSILLSFDTKDLSPSVPINPTINQVVSEILKKSSVFAHINDEFISLLKAII